MISPSLCLSYDSLVFGKRLQKLCFRSGSIDCKKKIEGGLLVLVAMIELNVFILWSMLDRRVLIWATVYGDECTMA